MNLISSKTLCAALLLSLIPATRAENLLGVFTDQGDIGTVSKPGSVVFDPAAKTYTVGASGANMWFKEDAMHFVWKKVSGDGAIAAQISWVGTSTQNHRKACLVIRQDLTPGSAYVDVAQHGDGLTSLQFRTEAGGVTKEIQSMTVSPSRVRLDKIADMVFLSVATEGDEVHPSGASVKMTFTSPFYIGLAVSAHDNTAFETAIFSKVEGATASLAAGVPLPGLKVITLPTGDQRVTDQK